MYEPLVSYAAGDGGERRSPRYNTGAWWRGMLLLALMVAVCLAVIGVALLGCAGPGGHDVPDGYDADLTPTNNGAGWVGGR